MSTISNNLNKLTNIINNHRHAAYQLKEYCSNEKFNELEANLGPVFTNYLSRYEYAYHRHQ